VAPHEQRRAVRAWERHVRVQRAIAALDWTMRVHRPLWLDAAGLHEHAETMRALPEIVDEATSKAAIEAQDAAIWAAWAAWDAWAARAAWDAWDARDALQRLAEWCLAFSGSYLEWDLSWLTMTLFGARQNKKTDVIKWSEPLCAAYIAGCWQLIWTDDTLYWAAKPTVHVDRSNGRRRLHRADGPAVVSDIEDLHFWHGILVPRIVIEAPHEITSQMIDDEPNAEVRRVMIERYGYERYVSDGVLAHEDATGRLIKKRNAQGDEISVVSVVNGSKEPDGTYKRYVLSVPPECKTAVEAVAWSYGMSVEEYSKLKVRT
jgi:hypothetical protein